MLPSESGASGMLPGTLMAPPMIDICWIVTAGCCACRTVPRLVKGPMARIDSEPCAASAPDRYWLAEIEDGELVGVPHPIWLAWCRHAAGNALDPLIGWIAPR